MALITDRAGGAKLGRATGRGLMFIYCGVVVIPPLLGILRDALHSWPVVWSVATAAVFGAATPLALGPKSRISVPTGESAPPPRAADGAGGADTLTLGSVPASAAVGDGSW
jgi:hypothetical protein